MNNKLFISVIATLLTFGSVWFALAAPAWTYERTLLPESDNAFDLGTTTQRWRNTYAVTASSTNLIVSGLSAANCDVKASSNGTFSCGTDSTGATDPVATSTNETAGRLSYWTTTSGTPARLGDVATTTLTATAPIAVSNAPIVIGGTGAVITCATADTNTTGCLTDTDWDTFNNKGSGTVTSIATTYPITGGTITTTGTLGIAFGTTTSNTWASTQTFGAVAGISLDEIENLSADKTFTMAANNLTFNFTSPSSGLELNATGAFTDHILHIHQSIGNPGAGTQALHVHAEDPDVILAVFEQQSASTSPAIFVQSGTTNLTGGLTTMGYASSTQIGSTGSAYFATASGNVGIGTTSPGTLLSIGGASTGINFRDGTTATSTFNGNVRVVGNLQVDGNFFAPVTLVNSGNVRIDGTLNVVGAVDLDTYTSAILLTGAGGDVAEYAGTSCTNQAITVLSALGAATCTSINNDWWSGADLSVANGGTGVSTFTSSQLLYGNGTAALSSVATTTLSIGLGLSHSGTLGALVGGSAGTLTIATSSLYAGTTGLFPYFSGTNELTATSTLFLSATGYIGVSSTTPGHLFSVGAYGSHFAVNSSGTIMSAASQPATSTAITLNWATTPNSVEYRLGGAATTITVINATTSTMWGSRKLIQLWNPSGAAGAVTFVGVEFSSAYTQTTAANRGDLISCVVSLATSTTAYKVFCTAGAASQ